MSIRYEGAHAVDATVEWDKPGAEIGEDTLDPGIYALTIGYDEVFYLTGTPAQLKDFMVRMDGNLQEIEAHAAAPLTLADFEPDEDGTYPCPRCETGFEPRDYEDLAGMIASIQLHIETDHPVVKDES